MAAFWASKRVITEASVRLLAKMMSRNRGWSSWISSWWATSQGSELAELVSLGHTTIPGGLTGGGSGAGGGASGRGADASGFAAGPSAGDAPPPPPVPPPGTAASGAAPPAPALPPPGGGEVAGEDCEPQPSGRTRDATAMTIDRERDVMRGP